MIFTHGQMMKMIPWKPVFWNNKNLGSRQSAIVIEPVSPFASVKCWADDGGLSRLFKLTFTMASCYESTRARVWPIDGTLLGHVSLLRRQTILEVRKPEFGTASARCCAENKYWWPEFGPKMAAKCIPKLSFQQRHDIGNRSSANFCRCWASVGPYLTLHLGSP